MKKLLSLIILSLVTGQVAAETSFNDFVRFTGWTDTQAGIALFLAIILILIIITVIVWGIAIVRTYWTSKIAKKRIIKDIENFYKQTNTKNS